MPDALPSERVRDRDRPGRADDSGAPSGEAISVALIEDDCLEREGITSLLAQFPEVRVAASDSKEFEVLMDEAAPDVVLLELDLIDTESIVIARALQKTHPEVRVILLDHYSRP